MNSIIGLGKDTNGSGIAYNFIDRAYEEGLLKYNTYAFQGVTEDEKYAHLTIGGYNAADMDGDIDWYSMDYETKWKVNITTMTLDSIDLTAAPPAPATDELDPFFIDVL